MEYAFEKWNGGPHDAMTAYMIKWRGWWGNSGCHSAMQWCFRKKGFSISANRGLRRQRITCQRMTCHQGFRQNRDIAAYCWMCCECGVHKITKAYLYTGGRSFWLGFVCVPQPCHMEHLHSKLFFLHVFTICLVNNLCLSWWPNFTNTNIPSVWKWYISEWPVYKRVTFPINEGVHNSVTVNSVTVNLSLCFVKQQKKATTWIAQMVIYHSVHSH